MYNLNKTFKSYYNLTYDFKKVQTGNTRICQINENNIIAKCIVIDQQNPHKTI